MKLFPFSTALAGDPGWRIGIGRDKTTVRRPTPAHVTEDVAYAALRQDHMEGFILQKVQQGAGIRGVYPADAATRAEYKATNREPK
jgi:hypothetical protein